MGRISWSPMQISLSIVDKFSSNLGLTSMIVSTILFKVFLAFLAHVFVIVFVIGPPNFWSTSLASLLIMSSPLSISSLRNKEIRKTFMQCNTRGSIVPLIWRVPLYLLWQRTRTLRFFIFYFYFQIQLLIKLKNIF